MIVHEQGFSGPFSLIVAGAWANRVDASTVIFSLRMDLGVAINLAGRRLQNLGPTTFCHPKHVDCPEDRRLHGLDRVELVMARCRRASKVVDFIHFQPNRVRDVVANQFEIATTEKAGHVVFLTREKVVEADNVMPLADKSLAQVGS